MNKKQQQDNQKYNKFKKSIEKFDSTTLHNLMDIILNQIQLTEEQEIIKKDLES